MNTKINNRDALKTKQKEKKKRRKTNK